MSDYNPDDHTVAEVQKYLATADAQEAATVKAMEASGQNRKGILEFQPDPQDVPASPDGYTRVPVAEPYQMGTPIKG